MSVIFKDPIRTDGRSNGVRPLSETKNSTGQDQPISALAEAYPMKDGKHDPAYRLRGIKYSLYKNKNSSIEWDGQKITSIDGDIGAAKSFAIVKDLQKMDLQNPDHATG